MAASSVERRLAAILAADVVGYARLIELDEAGTLSRIKGLRQDVIEPILAQHGGRIVKLVGDGALVEFASASEAVLAAAEMQQSVSRHEREWPADKRVRFRIGISLGDVVHEDGDIFGEGVNLAARLEGLAEPGGICVSGAVHEQARNRVQIPFAPMGRHRVKNLAEPVEAWQVVPDGSVPIVRLLAWRPGWRRAAAAALVLVALAAVVGWWWQRHGDPAEVVTATGPPSVAVLPFDDFGGDQRQQRFADGFTEDLITELARANLFLVIARNSVETFKGRDVDVREVGRKLGVRYVLEGSMQLEAERVRITAQLVETTKGTHLWSERYDRPANDLFAVRDEILTRLVGTLTGYDGPISSDVQRMARQRPAESLAGWDYGNLAKGYFRRHDPEGNAEAKRLLEKAIELDPGEAGTWAFLSDTYAQDWINGWSGDRPRSLALMREAAEKAVELDPVDPYALLVLGTAYFAHDEVELGSAAWERALVLGPNNAIVTRSVGGQLAIALGAERAAQGAALVERALFQLDPLHPLFQNLSLAIPLYFAGRYAEAVAVLEKIPDPWLEVRIMLALSSAQAGLGDKARRDVEGVLRLEPDFTAEAWVDNDFYQPGGSSAALFFDGARKAGLPLCAPAMEAVKFAPLNRLPECEAQRSGLARQQ